MNSNSIAALEFLSGIGKSIVEDEDDEPPELSAPNPSQKRGKTSALTAGLKGSNYGKVDGDNEATPPHNSRSPVARQASTSNALASLAFLTDVTRETPHAPSRELSLRSMQDINNPPHNERETETKKEGEEENVSRSQSLSTLPSEEPKTNNNQNKNNYNYNNPPLSSITVEGASKSMRKLPMGTTDRSRSRKTPAPSKIPLGRRSLISWASSSGIPVAQVCIFGYSKDHNARSAPKSARNLHLPGKSAKNRCEFLPIITEMIRGSSQDGISLSACLESVWVVESLGMESDTEKGLTSADIVSIARRTSESYSHTHSFKDSSDSKDSLAGARVVQGGNGPNSLQFVVSDYRRYRPDVLVIQQLANARYRHCLQLPSYTVVLLPFKKPEMLKQDANRRWRAKWEHLPADLSLSKILKIRKILLELVCKRAIELSTAALAVTNFEKLCIEGYVGKENRKIVAASCTYLACKFNESTCFSKTKAMELLDTLEESFDCSDGSIVKTEMAVFIALDFQLFTSPSQVLPHFAALGGQLCDIMEGFNWISEFQENEEFHELADG